MTDANKIIRKAFRKSLLIRYYSMNTFSISILKGMKWIFVNFLESDQMTFMDGIKFLKT